MKICNAVAHRLEPDYLSVRSDLICNRNQIETVHRIKLNKIGDIKANQTRLWLAQVWVSFETRKCHFKLGKQNQSRS